MTTPEEASPTLYRSLIRVEHVHRVGRRTYVLVVIPGWSHTETVAIDREQLPAHWDLKAKERFFARASIGAKTADDLMVDGPYELCPPLDPNDGLA